MSKRDRQGRLIKLIALEPWRHTHQSLTQVLGVKEVTVQRDLDELKARGYIFEANQEGSLFLQEPGWGEYLPAKDATIRQIEILRYLDAQPNGLELSALEAKFRIRQEGGVGDKTIERAVKELEKRELVRKERDRYVVNRHKILPPLQLGEQERVLLLHALTVAQTASPWPEDIKSLDAKFRLSTADSWGGQSLVYVHGKTPTQDIRRSYYCRWLENAARTRSRIRLLYRHGAQPAAEIMVNPLGLVYYWVLDNWYLVAQDTKADQLVKTYLLDRILAVEDTEEQFAEVAGFVLQDWFKYAWGVFRRPEPILVRIKFYKYYNTLERAKNELAIRDSCRWEAEEDGWIMEDQVEGLADLAVWLRGFGPGVEVLEPAELRQLVYDDLLKLVEMYGQGD